MGQDGKSLGVAFSKPTLEQITLEDGGNIVAGTTTGSKIGTATSQKLGFFNATPIDRPTAAVAVDTTGAVTGSYGFATTAQFNAVITAINALRANAVSLGLAG